MELTLLFSSLDCYFVLSLNTKRSGQEICLNYLIFLIPLSCSLQSLSLADCPIAELATPSDNTQLQRLNLSDTAITSWSEVDKIRQFPSLSELRIMDCPFNNALSADEKRAMIIARLPNIKVWVRHFIQL